jgi:hypothetical protein
VFASRNLFKATSREIAALTRPVNAEASKLQKKANPSHGDLILATDAISAREPATAIPGMCVKTVTIRKTFNAKAILRIDGKFARCSIPLFLLMSPCPSDPFDRVYRDGLDVRFSAAQ